MCHSMTIQRSPTMSQSSTEAVVLRKWMCVVCGYIYDEAVGVPDEGIAPGTRWEDVPDTWTCPDCGTTKDDFEMIELD
jgi:rubredoxin